MADSRTITFDVRIKEIVKPSSPTPSHLKRLQLSLFDQLIDDVYVPLVFFYSQNDVDDLGQRSQILKSSLSNVLTQFYPLAGRMKENAWVECNDEGVHYTEAQVDCSVSEILLQPTLELLIKFPPIDLTTFSGAAANNGPLVSIQVSFFNCGGLAIGIWFSHKVLDVASLTAFMNSWAAVCRGDPNHLFPVDYTVAPSLFPSLEIPLKVVKLPNPKCKYVMKTFVFHSSKIAELKAKAASERVPQPTRVEAVTALIWKCAMAAASGSNYRSSKPSAVHQPVNLRKRIGSENSMGNLLGVFIVQIEDGTEVQLPVLVDQLRMKLEEATKMFEEKLGGGAEASLIIFRFYKEVGELYIKGDEIDVYSFSSWCKFPFYGADFGWGKPSWVSIPPVAVNNNIVLMDTKEGEGIEAWVTLREEDMALFKHDQELLTFASLSCSPLDEELNAV